MNTGVRINLPKRSQIVKSDAGATGFDTLHATAGQE